MQNKNTFLSSKMNTDLDERLIDKSEMVHAENIRVFSSEGSDSGVIETIKGNEQLTNLKLTNAEVLGVYADWSNRLLYYCVTSDEKDLVLEYDEKNKILYTIAEGERVDGVTWINFNRYKKITSIRKTLNDNPDKDLLIFTDNYNNIRCVNIKRGKDGKITNEKDWKLIKQPPRYPIRTEMTYSNSLTENNLEGKMMAFAYRYRYEDGELSALSGFTNYKFQPSKFEIDYETMENKGMINKFNAINLYYNTGNYLVKEIEIVFKLSNSNAVYLIEKFNKSDNGLPDDSEQLFKFSNNKIYAQLGDAQLFRSYDNVPRKAKSLALAQNRLAVSNYTEGYDMLDVDGQKVVVDYGVSIMSEDLRAEDITVETTEGIKFKLTNDQLKYDSKLSFEFDIYDKDDTSPQYDQVYSEFILNQEFATIGDLVSSEDFNHYISVVLPNAILNSLNNIDSFPEAYSIVRFNGVYIEYTSDTITLKDSTLTIRYPEDPNATDLIFKTKDIRLGYSEKKVLYDAVSVNTSLKTLRSYEVGILYLDEDSRLTPTLTCANNTQFVPISKALQRNKLQIEVKHRPPAFADRYKFVVKQSKGDYETIYVNRFYQDGIYRWAALEGANKDKVKEGDILIVKSDLGGPLETEIKVRVLEVTRNLEDFIKENVNVDDDDIIEPAGLYMKIKPTGFDMNYRTGTTKSYEGSSHLRYPVKTYTSPLFGETRNNVFTPYKLGAGSTVKMYINIQARGSIAFNHSFEKQYIINAEYDSFKEFFEAEIQTLGEFGRKYTNKYNNSDNTDARNHQRAEGGTYGTGYGFTEDGSKFYVNPWRAGTNSRNITTTIKIEIIYSDGTLIFETEADDINSEIFYETEQIFNIVDGNHEGNIQNQQSGQSAIIDLNFFNCFTQGNGAESYKYKDAFNASSLSIDIRPTSTITESYKEIQRFTDITYSEPYIENNGVNGLNEFNLYRVNYKDDIVKIFGQITHMEEEGTDLLIFQEDKISKLLVGKQMINTADGGGALTTTTSVLGEQIPYTGTYGTLHAESVARDANDVYFVDVKRGIVGRKGQEGITEISNTGMHNYFRDNLPALLNSTLTGGIDPYYNEYLIALPDYKNVVNNNLDCEETKNYTDYKGVIISKAFLTNTTGDFTFSINSNNSVTLKVYDNRGVFIEEVTGASINYTYSKTNYNIKYLTLYIEIKQSSDIVCTMNCPVLKPKTIKTLVYGDELTENNIVNISWNSTGNYVTPIKQYNVTLINGLSLDNETKGDTNSSIIPPDYNNLNMMYTVNEQFPLRWGDYKMKIILSNKPYSLEEIETLLETTPSLVTTSEVKLNGETVTKAEVNIQDYDYIYPVYKITIDDIELKVSDDMYEVEVATPTVLPITENDYSFNDLARVVIVTPPRLGTAYVNSDNDVVYTGNRSDLVPDQFTYKLVYGRFESEIAKVDITFRSTNITCDDNLTATGNVGVYKLKMNYGSNKGKAGISYDAFTIPDKFIIMNEGGDIITQTKYKGTQVGALTPNTYNLPVYEYDPTSRQFLSTGLTETVTVTEDDIDLTSGAGTLTFEKIEGPMIATIKVIAPAGGTAWSLTGICPYDNGKDKEQDLEPLSNE